VIFVMPVTFIGLRQNPTSQGSQTLSLRGRRGQRHMSRHRPSKVEGRVRCVPMFYETRGAAAVEQSCCWPLFLTHNRIGDKYFGFWTRPYNITDMVQTDNNINMHNMIIILLYCTCNTRIIILCILYFFIRSRFNYL